MEFSHIGIVTEDKKEGETFVEETRVWITDFVRHPHHVEWLRFESDSPVTGPLRRQPHVAYRVPSIEQASAGMKVLMEPDGLRPQQPDDAVGRADAGRECFVPT